MNSFFKAVLLIGVMGLAACTNPDRYGAGGPGGAGGIDSSGLGANDPDSPAYFQQTIGDKVHFAVDQHTLTAEAQATLARQAEWLIGHPSYSALIEGHADEQGTRIYNINLGERRANAVREFLISRGVAGNRITTISYGKERPLALCSQESCYAQNRRAVTVITAGAGV
ncbi:peptidoglycan-associated lipoprotein Pal [Frigidibacter sp. ROC022]|uniref:peptidoglycan-associated lipoprotein Pal n=1 Tax=Frigidibacter sp. ROC022 TaxID=2971796 RepID=UPI00215AD1DF|nr:peptidoglycan-associated lipoprotein Pal [Frigidibacter sp. ROC022]MCR8725141.1 peptidoglycan-associated lipoprotein Pal [Frigidibacter sp. ROC022]